MKKINRQEKTIAKPTNKLLENSAVKEIKNKSMKKGIDRTILKNQENSGLTFRAIIVAIIISLFLLASSMYISIKIGALPWPIIFAVIASTGIITGLTLLTKKSDKNNGKKGSLLNIHEINVAQAGASIGGLVAAGIAFTIPGILYLEKTRELTIGMPSPWLLALATVFAGLLGILLSVPLKKAFVDDENLAYPSGMSGAEMLKAGMSNKRLLHIVIISCAFAGIFALVRDLFFPAGFAIPLLVSSGIFLTIYPMPMACGIGYILGGAASFSWTIGAVIGWIALVPLLIKNGMSSENAISLIQNLGIGLVLGSGIGFFCIYVIPRAKKIFFHAFIMTEKQKEHNHDKKNNTERIESEEYSSYLIGISVLSIAVLFFCGVPLLASIIAVAGTWIMAIIAARMTGETNIDPLEQFGILVGLVAAAVFFALSMELTILASFVLVMFVSVACAVAGDIGHDYKSAKIIGTKFSDIIKVDLISVVVAGIAAPFILRILLSSHSKELFTQSMPAPQAVMVAGSIFGFTYPLAFGFGFILAFLFEITNNLLPERYKGGLLIMPLGIGLFLGLAIAIPLAVGGIIRTVIDKNYKRFYYVGLLIASGLMGGEGIAGFIVGASTFFNVSSTVSSTILIGLFFIIATSSAVMLAGKQQKV